MKHEFSADNKPWWMRRNEKLGDLWWRKEHKLIEISLPLSIPDVDEDLNDYIQQRLRLIKLYNFLDVKTLVRLMKEKREGRDCKKEAAQLKRSFPLQINDFDRTELVVSALKDRKLPDIIRAQMIPRILYVELFEKEEGFLEHESKYVIEKVAELALPKIRAKLAYQECLYLIDPTWDSFCELVQLCPFYISSRRASVRLNALRETTAYGKQSEIKEAKKEISKLQRALMGQTKRKERQLPYFQIHQEFKDMVSAFERYAKDRKIKEKAKEAEENLRIFAKVFEISDDFLNIVRSSRSKPAQFALEALIEKNLITSEASYRNNVKPYMEQLFKIYPDLEFDWSHVRRIIDFIICHPGVFAKADVWSQLEKFKMPHPREFEGSYPILANWV